METTLKETKYATNVSSPLELKKEDFLQLEKRVGKEKAFRIMSLSVANKTFLATDINNAVLH